MAGLQDAVRRLRIVQTYETHGADQATRKARDFAAANRDVAGSTVSVERATLASERSVGRYVTQGMAAMRQGAAAAEEKLAGVQHTLIGIGTGWIGYVAIAAGLSAIVRSAHDAIEAYRKFEEAQTRLQSALNATGGASGKTTADIERLAKEIGNVNAVREAAQELAKYRAIGGEVFDRTLKAANDLFAGGSFDTMQLSIRNVAQALTNLHTDGLAPLEQAGLRFSASQKAMLKDMVETGRAADAQREALKLIEAQIGGAGAARAGTLTGAYTALSDALQRGSEQWGQNIAQAIRLTSVIQSLAWAMNAINDFRLSSEASRFLQAISTTPLFGPLAIVARTVFPAESALTQMQKDMQAAEGVAAAMQPIREQQLRAVDAYDAVIRKIEEETAALKKSELEKAIDARLREAQVTATSKQGQEIARLETIRYNAEQAKKQAGDTTDEYDRLTKSIERQTAAHEGETRAVGQSAGEMTRLRTEAKLWEAAAQAGRDRTSELEAEIDKLARRAGDAAQRLAELKLRSDIRFETDTAFMSSGDQQIASRLRGVYGGEWRAHMNDAIAQQMRFNDVLKQTAQTLETNLASGLTDVIMGTKDFKTAFADTATAVLRASVEMAIRMYVLRTLMFGLSGLFGGGGGGGGLFGGLFGSANGNVFDRGQIIPFAAGGVIDRPILFPMANGAGLAGEAGPEAIMPLRRGADGRLGVVAQAARSEERTVTVHAPVTVIAPEPAKFARARGQISRTIGQAWQRAQRFS